jgi:transposase-like protein
MADSFQELEASSLFCPRCRQANPVRKKLLLVLSTGTKYDYTCAVCGTQVGGKTDSDSSEFHQLASASRKPMPPSPGPPSSRPPR